jgi:Tol biopolymer transport system component
MERHAHVRLTLLLALAACGRLHFDALGDGAAPPDAAPCTTWSPFSAPVALPGPVNSPADDWAPTPAAGELELYFYSFRASSHANLFRATRTTLAEQFDAGTALAELDNNANAGTPTVTADDLDIIYETDETGTGDLYEAIRGSRAVPFGAPQLIASLSSPVDADGDPFVSADGLRLVYVSSNNSIGGLDIFETTRPDRGTEFAPPTAHLELDSPSDEYSPTLSADGLEIFFASARAGGFGGFDIYTARRTVVGQPFANATHVDELSSPLDDVGVRLTPDGTTLYLNYQTMTSGGANADMWTARRTCLD